MTTLSAHSRLSNSLGREESQCANLSNACQRKIGTDKKDGTNGSCDGDGLVLDDEEIASVEADGNSGLSVPDDGGQAEKQLLTAALVSSIVEFAGTSTCGGENTTRNRDNPACATGSEGVGLDTMEQTEKRQPGKDWKERGADEKPSRITSASIRPNRPTSSSSLPSDQSPPELWRKKMNTKQNSNISSSIHKHNKLDMDVAAVASSASADASTLCAMISELPSQSLINARRSVPKQTSFIDESVPSTMMKNGHGHGYGCIREKQKELSSATVPIDAYKLNMSLVPNPLAGMDESDPDAQPVSAKPNLIRGSVSKNTNNLMSAAPAGACSGNDMVQLGGQLAIIAESMSSQHYQTDGLTASTVGEVTTRERGRIFSIDLDPAVFDFVGVADPIPGDKIDKTAAHADCTPVAVSEMRNTCVAVRGNESSSVRLPSRDRGFSFEFFSLGMNEDEPLPPVPPSITSISQEKRLRGDSIIFDPVSFREGGIHETSALLHIGRGNEHAVEVPFGVLSQDPPSVAPASEGGISPASRADVKGSAPVSVKTASYVKSSYHPKLRAKAKYTHLPLHVEKSKSVSHHCPEITSSMCNSNVPQIFSDDTIHMPHGSDAAAAAAAGMPQSSALSNDGFSISHTACPVELLNKGGRIGIYLPEERKARIAKFHSKRKIRIWRKRIKYDCRKKLADSRPRIKGRFVKRTEVDGEISL
mmetsp:Transcript_13419/g.22859  ORF Transcript_13419/g.22859 Transcript_13419/m.22859 type:complete len:704 (+) Transcript_13419:145-2256(+)|eukprot:CAMPEP_0183703268 /NCGR_PEP_ID=MMETSP0737-20130205/1069_1 /TAXON_ID=385413 /ORGANISM="Thalassiosira miniscula, Strain CCMP1093" /LENGTH=703 /DNA_ID=CAMNT_0025929989 /DNA_START=124 /DNA_END=2235 /DNA_ORIENTATION=+